MNTDRLSPRQILCLQLVAAGKTSWETARIVGITERTVNFHLQAACVRLGVTRRCAAVAAAQARGWLPLPQTSVAQRVPCHPARCDPM